MPMLGRLRVLRQWGGIVDMTMDGSPIIDRSPIDGLYLNAGWCYGGFKATPASGWCFAHLIARDAPHPAAAAIAAGSFRHRPVIDEKGQGAQPRSALMRIACPYCGERDAEEFSILRRSGLRTAARECDLELFIAYVYLRDNGRPDRGNIGITQGCRRWLYPIATRATTPFCRWSAPSNERLAEGGLVDRAKPLRFSFDAETIAALPATRSPRPCSPMTSPGGSLLQISSAARHFQRRQRGTQRAGGTAAWRAARAQQQRATTIELFDGLEAASQNRFPSLSAICWRLNDLLSPFLSAGFYYKSFMWPASWWEKSMSRRFAARPVWARQRRARSRHL